MIARSVARVAVPVTLPVKLPTKPLVDDVIPVTTTPVLFVSSLRLSLKYNSTCASFLAIIADSVSLV